MLIRCSALPKLMTSPRNKGEVLSETAKSLVKQMAKEDFYGYNSELSNKYLNKGIDCENTSIELLNSVDFANYSKNTERKTNEWLTGEPDIVLESKIIDIKTSWSLDTFPCLTEDINPKDYEMQLRGYMMLFDKPCAEVVYCMVTTPEELRVWESPLLHEVDHIAPEKRVTRLSFERDESIESLIIEKCEVAQKLYAEIIEKLNNK
jgi:hypothetical protein